MENASQKDRTCPALGLIDDDGTSLGFPSAWNCCYRSRPVSSPNLKHQEEFCLCEKYAECPIFLRGEQAPLPDELRAPRRRRRSFVRKYLPALTTVLILSAGAAGFLALRGGIIGLPARPQATETPVVLVAPTATQTPLPATLTPYPSLTMPVLPTDTPVPGTPTASLVPTSTPVPSVTPRPSATLRPSATPRPTATFTATATATALLSPHRLEFPIGSDHKFIIHKLLKGENLALLETSYSTSVAAIEAVNYQLTNPIWVGALIVIPDGFKDVSGMPAFSPFQVTDTAITPDLLAKIFSANLDDLKRYNGIVNGEILHAGDWILIPHATPAP